MDTEFLFRREVPNEFPRLQRLFEQAKQDSWDEAGHAICREGGMVCSMRLHPYLVLGFALTSLCACAPTASSSDDAGGAGRDGGGPAVDGGFGECAEATYVAEQQRAALLVVLDRSSSMAQSNKWAFAAQAIVQALDHDVFDPLDVGLYVAPSGEIAGPACIFNLPVACLAPPFPQIALEPAGAQKSTDASGVRRSIKDWLSTNTPDSGIGDASPMYNALSSALVALQSWPVDGKRMLLLVTDGTLSCNEFSTRPGFGDCNDCVRDWEDPRNLVDLLGTANAHLTTPVESFVVGVPGADTYDPTACMYPPYRMRLALSAIGYAGAPDLVPATCDGRTFTPAGADPVESCHFDLTQGGFNVDALADIIAFIRGEALGCVFELPDPGPGQMIDVSKVNVQYTVDGATVIPPKRSSPSQDCADIPCWDYTTDNDIELLGVACETIKAAESAEVKIVVGCTTIVL